MGAIIAAPMMQLHVHKHNQERNLKLVSSGNQRLNEPTAVVSWLQRLWLSQTSNQTRCTKGEDHGYTEEGFLFDVQCTVGRQTVGYNAALLPYPAVSRNPGQYSDNDGDGFEDVTGLPTHYDQCYAGWKGTDTNTQTVLLEVNMLFRCIASSMLMVSLSTSAALTLLSLKATLMVCGHRHILT